MLICKVWEPLGLEKDEGVTEVIMEGGSFMSKAEEVPESEYGTAETAEMAWAESFSFATTLVQLALAVPSL
jgi:hypothetical protein